MERIARETYDGKLKPGALDEVHIRKTYNELEKGASEGYGKQWLKVNNATGTPDLVTLQMDKNLYWFSGAKDHAMLVELNTNLVKDGKIQSWDAFKRKAMAINKTYNETYLKTDWKTAKQSAYMAQNWQEYVRSQDKYKNLKYKTQEDDKVREAHVSLNNVIKPVNDSWWDTHFPPNGYGPCRCYTVQTNEAATADEDTPKVNDKDFPPEFRTNVGKTGEAFKESTTNKGKAHPFIKLAKENAKENQVNRLFYKLQQQKAEKKLLDKLIKHPDNAQKIAFNKAGIKEAFNQPHKKYALKNMIIPYMDTLLPKSTYLGFVKRPLNNPMIKGSHIYKTIVDGVDSYIIVRERITGELYFYSISDSAKVALGAKK